MGKASQRRIDFVLKRKRNEISETEEDHVPLLLLELEENEQSQRTEQSHDEGLRNNEPVLFRGTEFLQRDPGLRPQIWQYPPEQRDTVRREYLLLGPMQPHLQNYKFSGEDGHRRRFQYTWFGLFPSWLEYSEAKHCAYCLFCFVSGNKENIRGGSLVFTVDGFDSWKRVNSGKHCAFLTHIGSGPCSQHNNAVTNCQDLMHQPCHIENVMTVKNKEKIERNRLRLKVSIASVKWLTLQACAFRGHDERPQSKNKGNFLEIVDLLAEFNPEIAEVVGGNAPYNSKYTSPEIQKELLGMFASKIRKHIRHEIGDSKFSILVDETCDVAKREQMALVLRFVGKGANQIRSLKRPGDTRWGSHFGSVYSLMEMFEVVNSTVQDIAADRSAGSLRGDADTCFSYMSSYEFVFTLCLMKEIFEITELLGQALQKKSQDIVNAIRLVSSTKECLQQLRSDDGYQEFISMVVEFCVNHSIDIPDFDEIYVMRGGRARHQHDKLTKEHYFRVEIFRATLDTQLFELNRRFNEKVMDLLSTSATLIPRNKFKGFKSTDICEMVKKYYPADFSQQDIYGLQLQLKHFISDASKDEELKNISTLIGLCQCLVETGRHTVYNFIDRLIRLLITLPVSTASAERAFFSMKIIKTRLRNKMEDDFLANSLLVNIEGEILETYSYEDVIEDFRSKKN